MAKNEYVVYVNYINSIIKLKQQHPNRNFYSYIRDIKNGEITHALNWVTQNRTLSNKMKNDYFPSSVEMLCKREMSYNSDRDNSISSILRWGTCIVEVYKQQVDFFVTYKVKYEKALFDEKYEEALKLLDAIEKKVCYSIWGLHQRFLILNLQEKQHESIEMLQKIKTISNNNNLSSFLLYYYEKLTNKLIGFDEYLNSIQRLLDSGDKKHITWKYFDHKLNIVSLKNVQGIKSALIFDEQLSFIDYYETYIDSLQVLGSRKDNYFIVKECICKIYKDSNDFRIRNLFLAFSEIDRSINLEESICSLLEKYTCGKYSELKDEFSKHIDKFKHDFNLCNLLLKAGIDISNEKISFGELWAEIYNIYTFNYEIEKSTHRIGGYYKLLYGTSWKYKILGILVRKLNNNYCDEILNLSVLNDNALTPLFYQVTTNNGDKEEFLDLFKMIAPATSQLHLYTLTGNVDNSLQVKIDPIRWRYYEIKQLMGKKEYKLSIEKCREFLDFFDYKQSGLYYQERVRRTLYSCYLEVKEYIIAMNLYVESYMISKELIAQMQLRNLINRIEVLSEGDVRIRANICRPIVLRLYYKSLNDEVITAYLDYLESQNCRTIKELIEKFQTLNAYDIIFLNKVCTQPLLMKDYVSKTEVGGSAAELRATVLRTLLQHDLSGQKEYLSELNSIYKSSQLQKKIDSFNHNRIFIDKENLFKYLREELNQEFLKFKSVQELKKVFHGSKEDIHSYPFLSEQYWDNTNFNYGIIEKIKKAYLNESPYSLEDFLSTRIRHNYCNDNLKRVFENEKLFSKKVKDNSADYIVNEYWKAKLSEDEYLIVIEKLSKFSQRIDNKIQEIKEKWIRIKKSKNSEGLFDYSNFTSNISSLNIKIDDIEEFYHFVIKNLDFYTNEILKKIRERTDNELRPYYIEAISELETGIRKLEFNLNSKREMLRKIEITKAKYIEDIETFKDIFNMDNEKYPDFTMEELIEFCCEIEDDMNHQFRDAIVRKNVECKKKYQGQIFPYLVDIMAIFIRNAVQHSKISNMNDLELEINVKPYTGSEIETFFSNDYKIINPKFHNYSLVFNVINNLSTEVDEVELLNNVGERIGNIYNGKFRKESIKEGGSGLYKVARTIYYNLNSSAVFVQKENKGFFDISIAIDLNKFEYVVVE
ncbi:hypothetical protein [Paenibacillus sp. B-A-8]|uniref:hypothetical protein n=1 Tax=Paenibacillus sp. B-A-8 TaxID=3400419 RepID=UPI003B0250E8